MLRLITLSFIAFVLVGCAVTATKTASKAEPKWFGSDKQIRITMYSDGASCPGECDSHVVFDSKLNGTQFAHLPNTQASKCRVGEQCEICLLSNRRQCLEVMYRGGGPDKNTFDFTPAFFQEICAATPTQEILNERCKQMRRAEASLSGRTNCITAPASPECATVMLKARNDRAADLPLYEQCLSLGQAKFNKQQPKAAQRSLECAYEAYGTGGPNSRGTRWRKLLPGACREGTFVGRDGLDCCSGVKLTDAWLGSECKAFYVPPARTPSR
ncbi:hypothetical protein [Pseudomonas sp. GOM6]|uniref:hypothetical protein n=1 Tax=Pseudomonas sp. GOM6 TaxID=3036944 RepID=UPI00240A7D93|nr:hypothetical protein [Pseudomonas sp. GOM6]MDG1581040.1 hypothetical protein [Pseudomonas sp. GOM6]